MGAGIFNNDGFELNAISQRKSALDAKVR